MASLVYTYIEKMGVGIRDEELRFSNTHRFEFDLKQRQLFYKRQNSSPFFGNKVSNISLIVGKNGVGKSSVLDLLSLNVKENTHQRKRDSYFNIFHIKIA